MVYIYILFKPFKDIIPGGVGWDHSTELLQGDAVQNIESPSQHNNLHNNLHKGLHKGLHNNLHNNTNNNFHNNTNNNLHNNLHNNTNNNLNTTISTTIPITISNIYYSKVDSIFQKQTLNIFWHIIFVY